MLHRVLFYSFKSSEIFSRVVNLPTLEKIYSLCFDLWCFSVVPPLSPANPLMSSSCRAGLQVHQHTQSGRPRSTRTMVTKCRWRQEVERSLTKVSTCLGMVPTQLTAPRHCVYKYSALLKSRKRILMREAISEKIGMTNHKRKRTKKKNKKTHSEH